MTATHSHRIANTVDIPPMTDTQGAAQMLGVHRDTLRHWASDGTGPLQPVRVGHRLRWSLDDIAAILRGEKPRTRAANDPSTTEFHRQVDDLYADCPDGGTDTDGDTDSDADMGDGEAC